MVLNGVTRISLDIYIYMRVLASLMHLMYDGLKSHDKKKCVDMYLYGFDDVKIHTTITYTHSVCF